MSIITNMLILLFLILINEALVELITKSILLEYLRDFFTNSNSSLLNFIGYILNCGYCCSFWTAMLLVLIFNFSFNFYISNLILVNFMINFIVSVLAIQRCSNYLHGISDRFFSTNKDVRYQA